MNGRVEWRRCQVVETGTLDVTPVTRWQWRRCTTTTTSTTTSCSSASTPSLPTSPRAIAVGGEATTVANSSTGSRPTTRRRSIPTRRTKSTAYVPLRRRCVAFFGNFSFYPISLPFSWRNSRHFHDWYRCNEYLRWIVQFNTVFFKANDSFHR